MVRNGSVWWRAFASIECIRFELIIDFNSHESISNGGKIIYEFAFCVCVLQIDIGDR